MAKCVHCGEEHPSGASFCPATGEAIVTELIPEEQTTGRKIPAWMTCGIIGAIVSGIVIVVIGFLLLRMDILNFSFIEEIFPSREEIQELDDESLSPNEEDAGVDEGAQEEDLGKALEPDATSVPSITPTPIPTLTPSGPDPRTATSQVLLTQAAQAQTQAAQTATPTATKSLYWNACPGTYLSRLEVGDKAFVGLDPPLPNRVRKRPNTSAEVLGRIQPGEFVEIINGPECSNDWVWWKVRALEQELVGWTSEGDGEDYWLVPEGLPE
jgi:hypothetical protein